MPKLKTAVVGLKMGEAHAVAYHLSEKSELRWVVDLDIELASSLAEELHCKATTNWKDVLSDVDAISFATPHHLHYPMALEALKAGKHVLMEKPLANTEEQCLELIKVAEENNVVLMLAYIMRFRPDVIKLKELMDSGKYGQAINAECWIEDFLPPVPDQWFARKDQLGGGVLFSHGCHYIDILLWLLGKPVRVTGLGTRLGTEWMEGEGTSHAVIRFESGALAHLITSWGMRYKDAPALLHVHTPQACFVLKGGKLEVITEEGRKTVYESPASLTGRDRALGECEHFLDCIQNGATPLTDGHEGLISHRVIWAIYGQDGVPVF
jgi:predicted dehydrogenase